MPKKPDERQPTVPTSFADVPPQLPGADYSYTVELVGTINREMGHLTAEVAGLKEKVKEQGDELKNISKDIHTAKTTVKIVGAILAALLAFAGWGINKAVDAWVATHNNASQQNHAAAPTKP